MTVKGFIVSITGAKNFSNWIIYVTVKDSDDPIGYVTDFSNWIIYVTVKDNHSA